MMAGRSQSLKDFHKKIKRAQIHPQTRLEGEDLLMRSLLQPEEEQEDELIS
jgi:hypothetical protein